VFAITSRHFKKFVAVDFIFYFFICSPNFVRVVLLKNYFAPAVREYCGNLLHKVLQSKEKKQYFALVLANAYTKKIEKNKTINPWTATNKNTRIRHEIQ
jgi:hypothetical protein